MLSLIACLLFNRDYRRIRVAGPEESHVLLAIQGPRKMPYSYSCVPSLTLIHE
jgi:hypothetical protein